MSRQNSLQRVYYRFLNHLGLPSVEFESQQRTTHSGASKQGLAYDSGNRQFVDDMSSHPHAVRIADATICLVRFRGDDTITHGAGVVVRNSGASLPNRILTAGHVAGSSTDDRIGVISSDGRRIGIARKVASLPAHAGRYAGIDIDDQTVLEIEKFVPGGRRRYQQIEGLELAPLQASDFLTGFAVGPSAASPGGSGGPLVDAQGRVAGLLTSIVPNQYVQAACSRPMFLATVRNGFTFGDMVQQETRSIVADRSRFFAVPIGDPSILAALRQVPGSIRTAQQLAAIDANLCGYGNGVAMASRVRIEQIDRDRGVSLTPGLDDAPPGSFSQWKDFASSAVHVAGLHARAEQLSGQKQGQTGFVDRYKDDIFAGLNRGRVLLDNVANACVVAKYLEGDARTLRATAPLQPEPAAELVPELRSAAYHVPWTAFMRNSSPPRKCPDGP